MPVSFESPPAPPAPPGVPGASPAGKRPFAMGGILGIIGSVTMAVAVFLPWASFEVFLEDLEVGDLGIDPSIPGTAAWQGYLVLALALSSLVCAILAMALVTAGSRKAFGIVLLVSGLVAAVATLTQLNEYVAYGVFVALAGALLTGLGGALALSESRRLPRRTPAVAWAPPPPPPP